MLAPAVSVAKPILINVSGPYAVGKDTILNAILSRHPERVHRVHTLTTRPVSKEADPTYDQVSREELERRVAEGGWISNTQLSGATSYGTSIIEIEQAAAAGKICVHSIYAGRDGAGKLREIFGRRLVSIGLLATRGHVEDQLLVLRERLLSRARDDAEAIEARLRHQVDPLGYVLENPTVETPDGALRVFDRVLINEDLETTVASAVAIFERAFLPEVEAPIG
jgi:guanylate kinase